jgi:hypothetical protein
MSKKCSFTLIGMYIPLCNLYVSMGNFWLYFFTEKLYTYVVILTKMCWVCWTWTFNAIFLQILEVTLSSTYILTYIFNIVVNLYFHIHCSHSRPPTFSHTFFTLTWTYIFTYVHFSHCPEPTFSHMYIFSHCRQPTFSHMYIFLNVLNLHFHIHCSHCRQLTFSHMYIFHIALNLHFHIHFSHCPETTFLHM